MSSSMKWPPTSSFPYLAGTAQLTFHHYHRNSFEMAPSSTPRLGSARAASLPFVVPFETVQIQATVTYLPPPPPTSSPYFRKPMRTSPTAWTL